MYDVAIIGAGITGCSIAYELGKYNVNAVVIEKKMMWLSAQRKQTVPSSMEDMTRYRDL